MPCYPNWYSFIIIHLHILEIKSSHFVPQECLGCVCMLNFYTEILGSLYQFGRILVGIALDVLMVWGRINRLHNIESFNAQQPISLHLFISSLVPLGVLKVYL